MTPPQNLIPHGKTVYAGPRGEGKQRRQWRPYCITGKKTTHLPKAWGADPTALFSPCPALATSTVPDSQHILAWPLPLLAFAVIYPSPSAPLSRSGTGHPQDTMPQGDRGNAFITRTTCSTIVPHTVLGQVPLYFPKRKGLNE